MLDVQPEMYQERAGGLHLLCVMCSAMLVSWSYTVRRRTALNAVERDGTLRVALEYQVRGTGSDLKLFCNPPDPM